MNKSIRPVPGFCGYFCSKDGVVYSNRKKSWGVYPLKPKVNKDGYHAVCLQSSGRKHLFVHQVVAMTFIGPIRPGLQVNHKNGERTDNRVSNLEYVTFADNERHARRILGKRLLGDKCSQSKLTSKEVREIRRRLAKKESRYQVANSFGVSLSQISRIARGENWGHLTE